MVLTHSNLIATSSLVAMFVPERERGGGGGRGGGRERSQYKHITINNLHYATRQVTNERQQLVTPKLTILTTTTQTQLKWVVMVTNQNKQLD